MGDALAIEGFGELAGAVGLLAHLGEDLRQFCGVQAEKAATGRGFWKRDRVAESDQGTGF
jgi:hypothetical protein